MEPSDPRRRPVWLHSHSDVESFPSPTGSTQGWRFSSPTQINHTKMGWLTSCLSVLRFLLSLPVVAASTMTTLAFSWHTVTLNSELKLIRDGGLSGSVGSKWFFTKGFLHQFRINSSARKRNTAQRKQTPESMFKWDNSDRDSRSSGRPPSTTLHKLGLLRLWVDECCPLLLCRWQQILRTALVNRTELRTPAPTSRDRDKLQVQSDVLHRLHHNLGFSQLWTGVCCSFWTPAADCFLQTHTQQNTAWKRKESLKT